MSMDLRDIPELDQKGLRHFALITGAIILALFGFFLPWFLDSDRPTWPWVVAAVLAALGLIAPTTVRPVYRIWMYFGLILSRITTPVILGLVFFLMITPVGLIRRMFGIDPMARKLDEGKSYRIQSKKAATRNLERPF